MDESTLTDLLAEPSTPERAEISRRRATQQNQLERCITNPTAELSERIAEAVRRRAWEIPKSSWS